MQYSFAVCRKACLARIEYCDVDLWAAIGLARAIFTNVLHHIRVSRTLIGTQVLSISSPMDKHSLKRA